jgi:hypothetical protein
LENVPSVGNLGVMARSSSALALALLLPANVLASAAATDEALVARLEAAATPQQIQQAAGEIHDRLQRGAVSTEHADRLVLILTSREPLADQNVITILRDLGAVQEFSEAAIGHMAGGLAGDVVHNWTGAELIATELEEYQAARRLPEPAFSALLAALEHRGMLNRSAAIDALAAMPEEDPRHARAVAALVAALENDDHEHTRSSAIKALGRIAAGRVLPAQVLAALDAAASDDPYMTVRIDALELLVSQPLDPDRRQRLTQALARELVAPTHELWERSRGLQAHSGLEARAVELLARWFEGSYPPYVIEALIELTRKYNPDASLARLAEAHSTGGLTDAHLRMLEAVAQGHPQPRYREAIYRLIAVPLQETALTDLLEAFEHGADTGTRIAAGYALQRFHADRVVPMQVSDIAERVMLATESDELRGIAAGLVARGDEDFDSRERRLLRGLATHPDAPGIQQAVLDLYGPDRLEELVARHVADAALSLTFRRSMTEQLGHLAAPGRKLSPQAAKALNEAARSSSDYLLIGALARTLEAWNIDLPLVIHLKKWENQSRALFVTSVSCAISDLVAGLAGLAASLMMRLGGKASLLRRACLVLGWLVLSVGMLFLMTWGAIGYLGHNSAPLPIATLTLNAPLYVATPVYILLAWILVKRMRRSRLGTA